MNNLFPHLTILENCTLAPIWVKKMPRQEAEDVAMHYLRPSRSCTDRVRLHRFLPPPGTQKQIVRRRGATPVICCIGS